MIHGDLKEIRDKSITEDCQQRSGNKDYKQIIKCQGVRSRRVGCGGFFARKKLFCLVFGTRAKEF